LGLFDRNLMGGIAMSDEVLLNLPQIFPKNRTPHRHLKNRALQGRLNHVVVHVSHIFASGLPYKGSLIHNNLALVSPFCQFILHNIETALKNLFTSVPSLEIPDSNNTLYLSRRCCCSMFQKTIHGSNTILCQKMPGRSLSLA
jgi:hypothetical protein